MSTYQEPSSLLCLTVLLLLGKEQIPTPFPDGKTDTQGKSGCLPAFMIDVSHRTGT